MNKVSISTEVGFLAKSHLLSTMEAICHNRGVAFTVKDCGGIFFKVLVLTFEGKEENVTRCVQLLRQYEEGSQSSI